MLLTKALNAILLNKVFNFNGYKYTFFKIGPEKEKDFEGHYLIEVNCTLPKKGQGYVLEKMREDVKEILNNARRYIGVDFAVSYRLLLDYKKPLDIFCPYNLLEEILQRVKKSFSRIDFKNFSVECDYTFSSPSYEYESGEVNFLFDVNVQKILLPENVYVEIGKLSKDTLEDLATFLQAKYIEESDLKVEFENIIYDVTEPDFQIAKLDDVYLNAYFHIKGLQGKDVKIRNYQDRISISEFL